MAKHPMNPGSKEIDSDGPFSENEATKVFYPERGQELSDSMAQKVIRRELTYDQAMAKDLERDAEKFKTISITTKTHGGGTHQAARKPKFKLDKSGNMVAY